MALRAQVTAPARYVLLVTVDGFRPEFYLDSAYGMPTVRELMKHGVAAEGVNPVFPSVTYPDHTTMVTGVTPAKHGIYYNTFFEPAGSTGQWYWDYKLIRTPTIWSAMHDAGKTTACVRWPVTYEAPIDYRIPEYWDPKNMQDSRGATAAATWPLALWKEVQDSATGYLRAEDIASDHEELIADENMGRIAGYILRRYKPNFMAVHLAATDHYEHEEGRDAYIVKAAVSGADRAIKTMLEGLRRAGIADSTLVVILGDHGFENIYRSFNPNAVLALNGLIGDVKKGQWKAQFHSSGGSGFLQLKDPKDVKTLERVKQLLTALPDTTRQYFAVVDKGKLTAVGADPGVQLAITGLNGTTIGNGTQQLMVTFPKVKGTHGFFPDHQQIRTGFVACGPGLQAGVLIPEMNMVDVAPVIVALSGIKLEGMEGKVPAAILNSQRQAVGSK
ncbi:hypothetical protein FPE01S_04_04080 [Flavihumibacter petaseus NBRC 106054]|uniref:Alkaline phosphatase family protein n=1 Tax=Flavihumibacter petaseus NBRC 106054 TaxID=1220578 RepID=A0A0E9N5R8_9BACT|nr:hypothetical protein FPE01S_04_04080 [Flavihumibacter petaseus NBRC 106054]